MTKRLATDAKIVLERAGYVIRVGRFAIFAEGEQPLHIAKGTVSNTRVCELLKAKGFDECGYPLPNISKQPFSQ